MEIRFEQVMFFLVWSVILVLLTTAAVVLLNSSLWQREAIRHRVATYSEDTGKFQWIKPCEDIRAVEGK